jgi:sulfite reductase alpha subunit-like flavoprotein
MEYELSLEGQHLPPAIPPPKYSVTYLSESGPSKAQQEMLAANDHSEFCVLQNDLISARHKTSDGAWRSVRHIDLRISDDQQLLVSQHASNIGVYAPNDTAVVDRVAMLLGVDQGLVFIAEPLVVEDQAGETTQTEFPDRPFARIGTVRDALTWAFDLNSTPRSSFLRSLAAYATDPDECTRLSTPHVAETIQAQRYCCYLTCICSSGS